MQTTFPVVRRLPGCVKATVSSLLNVASSSTMGAIGNLGHQPPKRPRRAIGALLRVSLALCAFHAAGCLAGVTLSPMSLSWASVPVGGKGAQKVVTLTNIGPTAITISSVAISGTNPGDFQLFSKTCGTSLAASASCTANIIFAPTVAGARSATLTFKDTGTANPQSVALTGTATAATSTVTATPSSITYGTVNVGASSASQMATLKNGTTSAETISGITISGTNAADFTISSKTCGTSLAAAASCTATIVFKPSAAGIRTATLNFSDTGSNSPQTVALTGTGASSTGSVTAAPTGISFANTAVGSTSSPQSVTLSNGTKAAITISSVAISGTNAAAFAISSKTCAASLAAAASCSASVVFKPTASGTFTATLAFTDTASNSPQKTTLSGSSASSSAFSIEPMNPSVVVNDALQFSATTDVSWSASCGTIASTSGLYSAPSTTGSCTVTATEISSTHPTVSTTVKVTSSPSSGTLSVYPTSASVFASSVQIFQAQLSTVPDGHSLSYSIDGVAGGNGTTGTITNEGVYTAPSTAGTHHLTVRDNSLGTTATATITVFSQVAVDFASRSTALHAVPAHFFGAERMNSMHNTADLDLVKAAGINYARFYAGTPSVFKTSTPNWGAIDGVIRQISAGGTKIILQMYQTPPWLQPASNPCGAGNANAFPTNLQAWGEMAAQYVKHMDATFPGVVTDYEIWNEPNTTALCVPAASRLSQYMKMYAAAAPLMRAQAKADGVTPTPRIGGPASAGMQSTWVNAMLSDPTISQNIDFLAYHDYMFSNVQLGAQWDTYNGTMSVYQKTQNSGAGPLDVYLFATRLVAAGKQPQGKNLPIYNTEYNLDWDFAKNCCANDFTYSPGWNGMYIADVLNSVYVGAPNTPSHMVYFAATAHPYFCLVGEINANMDCTYPAGSAPQPYPQYFLYQLLGATNYLGLQNGGHMANSISPGTKGNGLVVTAFYTANLDAIVLINPTADTYSNVPVSVANTGLTAPLGTLYQIMDGRSIQSSSLSLQSQGGTSYSAAVTIGPYSVQAISIHH